MAQDFGNLAPAVFEKKQPGSRHSILTDPTTSVVENLVAVTPNITTDNSMERMRDSQRIHFGRVPTLKGYYPRQSKFFAIFLRNS